MLAWGDEGAQKGWCLYKMGCKGPETYANCATQRYADGTSWPIKAGAGCIGCAMPDFWDTMSPFYQRLPPPVSLAPAFGVDDVGALLVGGIAAVTVVHGTLMTVRETRIRSKEKKHRKAEAAARAEAAAGAPVADAAVAVAAGAPVTDAAVAVEAPPTMPVPSPVPPTPAVVTAVPEPSAATEPHAVPEPAADAGPAAGPRPPEAG